MTKSINTNPTPPGVRGDELHKQLEALARKQCGFNCPEAHGDKSAAEVHLPELMAAIQAQLDEAATKITFDSITLGWDGEQHWRIIVALQEGKVVNRHKVSDDTLRQYYAKHGRVITEAHIQAYGADHLTTQPNPTKETH